MLQCGHNICNNCLNKYSSTDHPKSSIKCEGCDVETKVVHMVTSTPNRAVCQILLDAESVLGRRLYSGGLRQDAAQSR